MQKYIFILLILSFTQACKSDRNTTFDRFPEGKNKELITIEGISVPDPELSLQLFAKEPDLFNPTNMDVDHKGRVWITEAYNYRNDVNNIPYNIKGDKIVILEDTDGDGKADKSKLFYQGEDINSALGIAVLGNKVIVSCSPNTLVFTDTNGDDVPDSKEILFKTKGGLQSDHGLHAFVFGPDGKLYFNFGNFGEGLLDKNGNPIKDIYGRIIDQTHQPFQDGMSIRCDMDGKNFEVLGWNFRNQYELCVDSFGRIWQSDNDDDGKRANRINYLIPGGNYGYKDEMTYADWRVSRTNLEDSVWNQHWHQNDPGVIPNLLVTGSGSPTGILMYEGNQLPPKYKNSLFLADAGTNEVFSYQLINQGAGYQVKPIPILDAKDKDKWFRPSDLCVAPDGSIMVADWYDTGVGGHFVGDLERGRIYRIHHNSSQYKIKKTDFATTKGTVEALKSPNQATRFIAYQALKKSGKNAESDLLELTKDPDPINQVRAYWLLRNIDKKYIIQAAKHADDRIRAAAVSMAGSNADAEFLINMAQDVSYQVKEAVAAALYQKNNAKVWNTLAQSYKSGDKWFLEALGIAAEPFWDTYLSEYLGKQTHINDPNVKDIIWRSRAKNTSEYLVKLIKNSNYSESLRYFRALDFQNKEEKNKALLGYLKSQPEPMRQLLIFKHFDAESIAKNPEFKKVLPNILDEIKNENDFLDIVSKYNLTEQKSRIFDIMESSEDPEIYQSAASVLIYMFGIMPIKEILANKPYDITKTTKIIKRLGTVDTEAVTKQLILIFSNNKYPFEIREAAMLAMEGYQSDVKLWNLIKVNKIPKELMSAAKVVMSKTFHNDLKVEFEQKFGKSQQNLTSQNIDFKTLKGNPNTGKELYQMYCMSCHMVSGKGIDFGPDLSLIGKKLTKESIYNAIVNPNQGISFGYEGYILELNDGSVVKGLLTSKTAGSYMIKIPGSSEVTEYAANKVKKITPMKESMMPAFPLQKQEYLDLMEYLAGLK